MEKKAKFAFSAPKNVFFGPGESGRIVEIIRSQSKSSGNGLILILTDKGFGMSGVPQKIVADIQSGGFRTEFLDTVPQEPYSEDVDSMVGLLRGKDISFIVGVGGGSVLDTAKLISVLIKWGGTVADLLDAGVSGPGLPCVLIPTTAGTGSEATPNAIVALREKQLKVGIVSPFLTPDYVILDPDLTLTLPAHLTASTGVDAYCHVLECYTSKKANPQSDLIALEGIRLIDRAIRKSFVDGTDRVARAEMLLGSFYGGLAIASSGTTAVHALSYPLGGRFRIPHGVSNAILLVPIMDFNKDAIMEQLVIVSRTVGLKPASDDQTTVNNYISHLKQMILKLKIPTSMSEFGVPPEVIPELTAAAYQVKRLLDNNPKVMSETDIEAVYRQIQ